MPTCIPFTEWDAIVDELHQFGRTGNVSTEDGWIRIDFGPAYVELSRDGWISTAMALHEFEQTGVTELIVDHEDGSLRVEADEVKYTFRRPGG